MCVLARFFRFLAEKLNPELGYADEWAYFKMEMLSIRFF
jgi:hypothetical protein